MFYLFNSTDPHYSQNLLTRIRNSNSRKHHVGNLHEDMEQVLNMVLKKYFERSPPYSKKQQKSDLKISKGSQDSMRAAPRAPAPYAPFGALRALRRHLRLHAPWHAPTTLPAAHPRSPALTQRSFLTVFDIRR